MLLNCKIIAVFLFSLRGWTIIFYDGVASPRSAHEHFLIVESVDLLSHVWIPSGMCFILEVDTFLTHFYGLSIIAFCQWLSWGSLYLSLCFLMSYFFLQDWIFWLFNDVQYFFFIAQVLMISWSGTISVWKCMEILSLSSVLGSPLQLNWYLSINLICYLLYNCLNLFSKSLKKKKTTCQFFSSVNSFIICFLSSISLTLQFSYFAFKFYYLDSTLLLVSSFSFLKSFFFFCFF